MEIYIRDEYANVGWVLLHMGKPKEQEIAKIIVWQPEGVWSSLGVWWDGGGELQSLGVLNPHGGMDYTYYHASHIQQRRQGDKFVVAMNKTTKDVWKRGWKRGLEYAASRRGV